MAALVFSGIGLLLAAVAILLKGRLEWTLGAVAAIITAAALTFMPGMGIPKQCILFLTAWAFLLVMKEETVREGWKAAKRDTTAETLNKLRFRADKRIGPQETVRMKNAEFTFWATNVGGKAIEPGENTRLRAIKGIEIESVATSSSTTTDSVD